MATSRELRNKIRSISNTKKITRTMEMIATAKSRVCQKRIEAVKPYGDKLTELLRDLKHVQGGGDEESGNSELLRTPEKVKTEALIVITANRGLCGGYNTNTLKMTERYLEQRTREGVAVEVHMIGKKGTARFSFLGRELAASHTQFEDRPSFEEAESVMQPLLDRFAAGALDAVTIVSTRYHNAARQAPKTHPVLPLGGADEEAEGESTEGVDFMLEPSPEEILDTLLPLSLKMQLFQALVEAAASEQIARRIAMKNATDNAEEMVHTYTQLYNRTRQAGITQEILEVIGGVVD